MSRHSKYEDPAGSARDASVKFTEVPEKLHLTLNPSGKCLSEGVGELLAKLRYDDAA